MDYLGRSGVKEMWKAAEQSVVLVGDSVVSLRDPAAIATDEVAAQRRADLYAHDQLSKKLALAYPGVPIVSEEDSSHSEQRHPEYWLIDPIDGTGSWAGGFPGYVTQAAFIREGVVEFGAIHAPALHRTWVAVRGVGAFLNGEKLPIRESARSPLVVVDNYPEPRDACLELINWLGNASYKESGSLGLKAVMVASGDADVFVKSVVVRDWDLAPAMAVCAETGAVLTRVNGSHFSLSGSLEKIDGVVVAADEYLARRIAEWLVSRKRM